MNQVLLLNMTCEPIAILSLRDAVRLMLRGVVEEVSGVAARLRTPRITFVVPAVLRLRYYVNVPRRGATYSFRGVKQRDNYTCIYCGAQPGGKQRGRRLKKGDLTIDHILPKSRGGKSTWSNTACACKFCNQRKAARTPHEAGLKLRWEPKTPRTRYLVVSGSVPKEWNLYLEI